MQNIKTYRDFNEMLVEMIEDMTAEIQYIFEDKNSIDFTLKAGNTDYHYCLDFSEIKNDSDTEIIIDD